MLSIKPTELLGTVAPNKTSIAWSEAIEKLAKPKGTTQQQILIELADAILRDKASDDLLRYRALSSLTVILVQSGLAQGRVQNALVAWQDRSRRASGAADSADWIRAGYEKDQAFWTQARTEAAGALASFPAPATLLADAEAERQRVDEGLAAFAPVGALGATKPDAADRAVRVTGPTDSLFVFVRHELGWAPAPIRVEEGVVTSIPQGLPAGPTIIFRRIRS
jgi:hypothetical protein